MMPLLTKLLAVGWCGFFSACLLKIFLFFLFLLTLLVVVQNNVCVCLSETTVCLFNTTVCAHTCSHMRACVLTELSLCSPCPLCPVLAHLLTLCLLSGHRSSFILPAPFSLLSPSHSLFLPSSNNACIYICIYINIKINFIHEKNSGFV